MTKTATKIAVLQVILNEKSYKGQLKKARELIDDLRAEYDRERAERTLRAKLSRWFGWAKVEYKTVEKPDVVPF